MTKNTGKPYEAFVHEIYSQLIGDDRFTSVELDAQLEGQDGPRQIDVLLRSKVANFELITVIECRDYAKRLDITHVDGFHSKLLDVNASKGILISRKGFSKKAINKANRVGITLCVASEAKELVTWVEIQIPVAVTLVQASLRPSFSLFTHRDTSINRTAPLTNGIYLPTALRDEILHNQISVPPETMAVEWQPSLLKPPYSITDTISHKVELSQLNLRVEFILEHYFGYLSELPRLPVIHNLSSNTHTAILRTEDLGDIPSQFTQVRQQKDIPSFVRLRLHSVGTPTSQVGRTVISCIETGQEVVTDGFKVSYVEG